MTDITEQLKSLLDDKVSQYNVKAFIDNDPVRFPHLFNKKEDVEIVAFLASIVAWGNRKMILRSCERMFNEIMRGAPYEYLMGREWEVLDDKVNIHRTFFVADFKYICRGLYDIYTK